MRILFSLGTHTQDFTRMAMAIEEYAQKHPEHEMVVQTGYTDYNITGVNEQFDFCPKEKMVDLMAWADVLVLQGGWGGICEAVDMGKRTVVVPRINGPEHIHDQGQVTHKMEDIGCVIGVYATSYGVELPENEFRKNPDVLVSYAHKTCEELEKALNKAMDYDFKPLKRGSAAIVAETLKGWFDIKK